MAMPMPSRANVFFFFLTFALHPTMLFSKNTLFQGVTFTPYDSLISNSQMYKLHFLSIPSSSPHDTHKIYLGITFNNEDRVWLANYDTPLDEDSSPSLIIDDYGNMKIHYNEGKDSIALFSSNETSKINATAVLKKNGNLELHEWNTDGSTKQILWQSFDYPNNILLLEMKLGINKKTGDSKWKLTSWIAPNIPVLGSFTLGIDPNNTNQLVMWWKGDVFWTSGALQDDGTFPNLKLKFPDRQSYYFFRYENEDEAFFAYFDGPSNSAPIVLNPEGEIGGAVFVLCNGDNPVFVSGCVSPKLPSCRNPGAHVSMLDLKKGIMLGKAYKITEETNKVSVYNCAMMCLNSCSCYAYSSITEDHTGCQMWHKGTPFFEHPRGPTIYFIANDTTEYGSTPTHHRNIGNVCIVSVVAGALVILISSYLCFLSWESCRTQAKERLKQKKLLSEIRARREKALQLHNYSFESIVVATNNFSPEKLLSKGGFGVVYKGKLLDGQEVAIKRCCTTSRKGKMQFENEIELIPTLQHPNLIKLCGFCIEREERMLIYEYMPNKSLNFYLLDSENKVLLDCKRRLSILQDIAQGLAYLHNYSGLTIIHGDIKPSNILLDHEMNPKISDFGAARILGLKEYVKGIGGTYGYMSPEYIQNCNVSIKTDVFSFGVMLLEIVTSKKHFYHSEYPRTLLEHVWQLWNEGRALELIDSAPEEASVSDGISKCIQSIHIGLLCVQDQASDRPTMPEIVSFMTNETIVLPQPKQPAFFTDVMVQETHLPDADGEEQYSLNDVTMSPLDGR